MTEQLQGVDAAAFRSALVNSALGALVQGGGAIVREPEEGPHEVRAVARDPWGNTVVLYGPR
ncbi:glyoxalase/bleomycin resistance protein/dioxygenase [Streptomyces sparsogenes DSM 40356]|uniref:Glyoxalase/bleomycin resistance protein/dioxygenase n=1 Tax=Streptomyces sparsogenes DSM 40356 TaxID=1331668 RepID=A0A1R1SET8_9ACTN|nr:glyoxalase/bleomycin resistance protein/dioxygenase [Streptomyces sparsogenes DSM 40356]